MDFATFNPTINIPFALHTMLLPATWRAQGSIRGRLKEFPQLFHYRAGIVISLWIQWHTEGFSHKIK